MKECDDFSYLYVPPKMGKTLARFGFYNEEENKMKKYLVHISTIRTLNVTVYAESEDDAIDIVRNCDENGEYDNEYWKYADTNYDVWEER